MTFLNPVNIALILIGIATYILYMRWMRSKYPPGPWPLPIIGNLHLATRKPYTELTELARIYGPVITVWRAWRLTIVVSGLQQMKEALEKKGVDFAGRAMDTVGFKIVFNNNEDLMSRSYDDKFLTLRKLSLSIMKSKAIGGFSIQKVVEEEIQNLLKILKATNGKLVDPSILFRLPVSNTVMLTVLNIRFENEEDPEYLKWMDAIVSMASTMEKSILISIAPALGFMIPGIQSMMRSHMQPLDENIEKHIQSHEETYKEGVIRDLTDAIIQCQRSHNKEVLTSHRFTRNNTSGLVKNMILAGTETTIGTIQWAFLVLLHRRDIQRKIQFELDEYLDRRQQVSLRQRNIIAEHENKNISQLQFTATDKPNLPYLNAFIHEIFRLWPTSPLSIPHRTMVDTSIGKFSIPKNTDVILNLYACHRDEDIWEKPFDFIPERFLCEDKTFDYSKAKLLMTFGAGPRNCVGENLAKMEIFLCIANVLHTFELCSPSVNELPVLSDGEFRVVFVPYHYKMMFKMREAP